MTQLVPSTGVGSTRRLRSFVVAGALAAATSCGAEAGSGDGAAPPTDATVDAAQCSALRDLAAAQPPAGSLDPEEWRAAYDAYAAAAERAAAVSAGDDAQALSELAEVMRIVADDPTDPTLANRVEALATPIHALAVKAEDRCGVTFGVGLG